MPRLLVIDDRDHTIEMCHRHLDRFDYLTRCDRRVPCQVCEERERGCPLKCAHDYAEAAQVLARSDALPDLVVLDLHFAVPEERLLPEDKSHLPAEPQARKRELEALRRKQGLLILARLRREYPTLPVVLLTTTDTELQQRPAGDPLVYFCENEIVDSRTLASEITRALALHHQAQEGPIFWGQSRPVAELRRTLTTLARSPLPVLLQGETGTGKSYLAENFIHPLSGAKGPLVITDLSTIPPALLSGHLFGSRRGSYTGAVEDHAGVFEQAHGGTLLLDEIANLDLEMQRQLLLVIERGQVTRLGDVRPRPAAVKLVAATNQDLGELVQKGRFRADLYMRLNPATRLWVPPLRERREDLPELLRFALLKALQAEALRPLLRSFLARFPTPEDFREDQSVVLFGKPDARLARRDAFSIFISRRSLAQLAAYGWPGNQRELKMLATNALVFTLVEHLEGIQHPGDKQPAAARAPAILAITEKLIDQLLGQATSLSTGATAEPVPAAGSGAAPVELGEGAMRVPIEVRPGPSFVKISTDVERQYLRALFVATGGDLEQMASRLLGPAGSARRVHLRLNQLGLSLRELRGGRGGHG
ncbi:MAG TPA: sigma 54-interacting transcriptional regulator [Pseudomonadota bacterium]|nr:sigma 54-interacting transcriptional regulator [Pseudomonadota bacterium]